MRDKAIYNLYPNVVGIVDSIYAYDVNENRINVDNNLVDAEVQRLQTEYDSTEYQRLREKEYPPITDYLDAVVKGDLEQQQAYIDACLAVKAKYPKPEGA
jgi:hypothetical protein